MRGIVLTTAAKMILILIGIVTIIGFYFLYIAKAENTTTSYTNIINKILFPAVTKEIRNYTLPDIIDLCVKACESCLNNCENKFKECICDCEKRGHGENPSIKSLKCKDIDCSGYIDLETCKPK